MKVIIRELSVVDAESRQKLVAVLKKAAQTIKKKWPDKKPEPWILVPSTGDVNKVVWVSQTASWTAHEEFMKEFVQDSEMLPLRDEYKRLVTANVVTQYGRVDPEE
jgi:hypothetical protein